MHRHIVPNWLRTSKGDPRGYIQPSTLEELWFHTGTNCNLRCPFCLEGSKPGDNRIQFITEEEAAPLISEALELGVASFSFTGGEPFLNPHMVSILDLALRHRPCLVLTNGTEPLLNQLAGIESLLAHPFSVSFRVSLDHPDAARHDAGRGPGRFRMSIRCLQELHRLGFPISIARLMEKDEDTTAITQAYQELFEASELPVDTRIVAFPDFLPPGFSAEVPEITESCMTTYLNQDQRDGFMCNFSKMVVKQEGQLGIYACTLVDDDPAYNLGSTLSEAMGVRVMLGHHRCYSCFAYGASCSERK